MKKMIFGLLLFLTTSLSAGGPALHSLMAEMYLEQSSNYNIEAEAAEFMRGVLFPDIRYIANLDRELTHPNAVTLEEVENAPSAFEAGILFHSYSDAFRAGYIAQTASETGIVDMIHEHAHGYDHYLLKLVEDEKVQKVWDSGMTVLALMEISASEEAFGIPSEVLNVWHDFLVGYLCLNPHELCAIFSLQGKTLLGIDTATLKEWSEVIPNLCAQKESQNHLEGLLHSFEETLASKIVRAAAL